MADVFKGLLWIPWWERSLRATKKENVTGLCDVSAAQTEMPVLQNTRCSWIKSLFEAGWKESLLNGMRVREKDTSEK